MAEPCILAISSPGGHWAQLTTICDNLPHPVVYARAGTAKPTMSTPEAAEGRGGRDRPHFIQDANKDKKWHLVLCLRDTTALIRRTAPSLVITTGAAPGFFACLIARLTGRRCVFIDSIANAERLSLSARLCRLFGLPVLTQWQSLADGRRVQYKGSVLGELS